MRHNFVQLCKAEVEDFDLPCIADHDVAWLEVAMDDAGVMRRRYAGGYGDPVTKHVAKWQPHTGNHLLECPARDVLHRNRIPAAVADRCRGS